MYKSLKYASLGVWFLLAFPVSGAPITYLVESEFVAGDFADLVDQDGLKVDVGTKFSWSLTYDTSAVVAYRFSYGSDSLAYTEDDAVRWVKCNPVIYVGPEQCNFQYYGYDIISDAIVDTKIDWKIRGSDKKSLRDFHYAEVTRRSPNDLTLVVKNAYDTIHLSFGRLFLSI